MNSDQNGLHPRDIGPEEDAKNDDVDESRIRQATIFVRSSTPPRNYSAFGELLDTCNHGSEEAKDQVTLQPLRK
jgi:hypothetical protein